jgi:hypothetical protein
MRTVTVVPAYGRDYKSKAAALADWNGDKDFIVQDYAMPAKPINRSDAASLGLSIMIRYNRLTRVTSAG